MPDPDYTVVSEELPGSQVGLTIEVPETAVDAAYDQVLNRLARRAKIEGFRPGKAPRALIEARVGQDALRDEVIDALIPEVVGQVLEERKLEIVGRPRVSVLELERGKPGRLSATVSVMPEVTLPDLDRLQVERHQTEVTEEMVQRRLEALREAFAELVPVERPAQTGDVVIADIDVELEGQRLEAQSRRAAELELRDGALIAELLAALPGKRPGEQADATVQFPEDNADPQLAGKEAHLLVTVSGVKEKRLPALDDELAKKLSDGKYESTQALEAGVRADLEDQVRRVDDLGFEQAVLKEVVDGSQVEVPEQLIESELERELENLERRLGRQGLRLEPYLAYQNLSEDQWREQTRPEAEARLKVELVLDEAARRLGIETSEPEVDEYIEAEAGRDEQLKNQVEVLKQSTSTRHYFFHRLQRARTLDRLVELASAESKVAP